MGLIQISTQVNAPADKVWDIISDLDSETKYWKGTKQITNISKQENKITREITLVFRDSKCMQQITLLPKEKIKAVFTDGILKGTKTINLKSGDKGVSLEAVWDIKLSGMMGMFTGMVKKHIKNGTEQALQSIKEEAER
ncbi:MAG: type II toxin-antitoxin system RatA family toxin [Nitrosopumilaceae archaeon]